MAYVWFRTLAYVWCRTQGEGVQISAIGLHQTDGVPLF
jgi:hypothetical protein